MIRCPNCGAINRDGSRSCRECGSALPQTETRCPNCGAPNPVGNLFCEKCDARLISPEDVVPPEAEPAEAESSPVKGISLPTRSMETEEDASDLPDWLLDLTDENEADLFSGETPRDEAEGEAPSEEAGYPDWLSGLVDEGAFEEGDASEGTSDEAPVAADELPDWLMETSQSDGSSPDHPHVEASEPVESADLIWETAEEGTPAGDGVRSDASYEGLPDWIAEQADPSIAGPETSSQPLPDWLIDRAVEMPPFEMGPARPLPAWLQPGDATSESGDFSESPVSEPLETEETEPAGLDWIAEAVEAGASSASETPGSEDSVSDPPRKSEESVTDGDMDLQPEEEEAGVEDLPDWLAEFSEPVPEEGEAVTPDRAPSKPVETADIAETEEAYDLDALPDWLSEDLDEAELEESEPEIQPPSSEPPSADEHPAEEEAEEALESEELPDWLAEVRSPEVPESGQTAGVFSEEAAEEPEEVLSEEVEPETEIPEEAPDWLRDIEPAEKASAAQIESPAFISSETEGEGSAVDKEPAPEIAEPEEMPEWLKNLQPSSPQPREQAEPSAASESDERLARANLPSWLQGLRPPEEGAGEAGPFAEGAEVEGLASAEIPDWVRALRPQPQAEGVSHPERRERAAPAEMEGPLSGLHGILASTSVVDIPSDTEVSLAGGVSQEVTEQAELWQELLASPRSAERTVAAAQRQRAAGRTWVRVFFSFILFFGVLAGLWILPPDLGLSQTPSSQHAPGIAPLRDRLEELQAGDAVIVAVEYGPAYSDEINAMAEALFEHLRDREVGVSFVSTLPEGTGLPQPVVAAVYGEDSPVGSRDYLPNGLQGIAGFLMSPVAQEAEHLIVLASRPLRVRWWIEQNTALQGIAGVDPLPMSVGVSASAGPLISPYLQERSVAGWLVGLPQALAYRELRGLDNAAYGALPDVLMLAHWIVAGFLFFGLLYYLAAGKKGAQ